MAVSPQTSRSLILVFSMSITVGEVNTQCYLPPGRGDIPALTPAEAGTRLSFKQFLKTILFSLY